MDAHAIHVTTETETGNERKTELTETETEIETEPIRKIETKIKIEIGVGLVASSPRLLRSLREYGGLRHPEVGGWNPLTVIREVYLLQISGSKGTRDMGGVASNCNSNNSSIRRNQEAGGRLL